MPRMPKSKQFRKNRGTYYKKKAFDDNYNIHMCFFNEQLPCSNNYHQVNEIYCNRCIKCHLKKMYETKIAEHEEKIITCFEQIQRGRMSDERMTQLQNSFYRYYLETEQKNKLPILLEVQID